MQQQQRQQRSVTESPYIRVWEISIRFDPRTKTGMDDQAWRSFCPDEVVKSCKLILARSTMHFGFCADLWSRWRVWWPHVPATRPCQLCTFISADADFTTTQRSRRNSSEISKKWGISSRRGKAVSAYKARVASRRSVNMFGRNCDTFRFLCGSLI